LKKLADTIGVQGHGIGDLVYNERIQQEVLKQLQAVGRKAGLAGIEIITGVVLADEEWTPQNVSLSLFHPFSLLTVNRIWSLQRRS
jgi:long-chain acyl-CoA synthetase